MVAVSALLFAGCSSTENAPNAGTASLPASSSSTPPTPPTVIAAPAALHVTTASWHLPEAVSRQVVLPVGPDLLMAGGLVGQDDSTATIWRIDPHTGVATGDGHLAIAVHDAAGVVLHGRSYIFGGGGSREFDTVQTLNPNEQATVSGRMPGARSDLVAAALGDTAYVFGGYDGDTIAPAVLETTDGATFTPLTDLPVPVRYPAVAVVGAAAWLFGGERNGAQLDLIQKIDLATGHASIAGHMPRPLGHANAFVLHGQVYLAGGQTPSVTGDLTNSDLIERVDTDQVTLTPVGHLPAPVHDAATTVHSDTAYLLGGEDAQRSSAVVEVHLGS